MYKRLSHKIENSDDDSDTAMRKLIAINIITRC